MPPLRITVLSEHVARKHLVDTLSRNLLTDGGDEHKDQEVQT